MRALWLCLVACVATACHYSPGPGCSPWLGSSISVPYVGGDCNGEYTRTLIRQLSQCGQFQYSDCGGCYQLCVTVFVSCDENIGFRYDLDKSGAITDHVIPIESRRKIVAEFSLIECATGAVVVGPERVSAQVEYDHEFDSGSDSLNQFSLGQVTDVEAARQTIPRRTGEALATKIVDYLCSAW